MGNHLQNEIYKLWDMFVLNIELLKLLKVAISTSIIWILFVCMLVSFLHNIVYISFVQLHSFEVKVEVSEAIPRVNDWLLNV